MEVLSVRNRYLLSLLLGAALIYYAIPQLHFDAQSAKGMFAFAWIGFAILVVAGNLSALVYLPKKAANNKRNIQSRKRRVRSH
jgi:hypothetical protein